MIYLALAYIDGTTLGVQCNDYLMDTNHIRTVDGNAQVKDVIPYSNLKIATRISEEEYIAYLEDDDEDDEPGPGTVEIPFP